MSFLVQRKSTFILKEPLVNVRADIALQVKSNDFLELKSLIPREHVKGTPPLSVFALNIRNYLNPIRILTLLKNIVFWNPHRGEKSFLVQWKSTFILKEPLVKVRADIALQVKINDFLEYKSLIPREHVKGTPPLSVFDLNIRNYRLLEPPSGQNGISATSQSHFNLNWFLAKDRGDAILQVTY